MHNDSSGKKNRPIDEQPVVKMLKPPQGGGGMNLVMSSGNNNTQLYPGGMKIKRDQHSSAPPKQQQPQISEQQIIQENAYRKLLQFDDLAKAYDKRLNAAGELVKKVKYSLYDAD